MPQGVLLVSSDPKAVTAVQAALRSSGQWGVTETVARLDDLPGRLQAFPNASVVVDLDPDPLAELARLDQATARFPEARFLAICEIVRDDLLLRAMQAGVRQFIGKDKLEAELPAALQRFSRAGSALASGQLFTLLSAGGGCGATTLAVNIAVELSHAKNQPTLLVDLDVAYGAAASYLAVEGQFGIADVLAAGEQIDAELLHSTAQASASGPAVLLSPVTTALDGALPRPIAWDHLTRAAEVCRSAYDFTVVDAPRLPLPQAVQLARASDLTAIVFQLNVKDVRMAHTILSALLREGLADDRIAAVANRCDSHRQMVSVDEAAKALGGRTIHCLRNDFRSAVRGINFGRPLESVASRGPLRKDILRFIEVLSRQRPEPVRTT